MKFSIRDLLLVTVIVALALGWWMDHRRNEREKRRIVVPYAEKIDVLEQKLGDAEDKAEEALRILNHTVHLNEDIGPPNSAPPAQNPPKP